MRQIERFRHSLCFSARLRCWRSPTPTDTLRGVSTDLLSPVQSPFHALAVAFVPEIAGCTPAQWDELVRIVSEALGQRPAGMRRQVLLFIRVLDSLARLRYGRRLDRLDRDRRVALLETVGNAPVLLLRRGIWGLRTLVMMGYYAQSDVQSALGYRADPRGWELRR